MTFRELALKLVRRPVLVVYGALPDPPTGRGEKTLQTLVRSQLEFFSRRHRAVLVAEDGRRGKPLIALIGLSRQWAERFRQWGEELDFTLLEARSVDELLKSQKNGRRLFFPKPEPPADLGNAFLICAGSLGHRLKNSLRDGLATAVAWTRWFEDLASIEPCQTVRLRIDSNGEKNVLFLNTLPSGGGAAGIARTLCDEVGSMDGWASRFVAGRARNWGDLLVADLFPLMQSPSSWLRKGVHHALGALDLGLPTLSLENSHDPESRQTILHLHNLHGDWISERFLQDLPQHIPVVWTLHDMQLLTGHCAHSLDCTKWKTGCGECPHLDTYPALNKDTTAWHWRRRQHLADGRKFHFVLPSHWLESLVAESVWKDHPRTVIHNGVDTRVFRPQPKHSAKVRLGLDPHKKVVLFAADLGLDNPWKGGRILLEAVRRLQSRRTDIEFVAVGSQRSGRSNEDGIFHVPYVSDRSLLAAYYSAADVLAYPSLADNCPLVVLEALACGTPVVSFQTGGIPELITHGVTGWLCQYGNSAAFLSGLEAVLNPEWPAEYASREAVTSVESKFSQTVMVGKYLELYESVLS